MAKTKAKKVNKAKVAAATKPTKVLAVKTVVAKTPMQMKVAKRNTAIWSLPKGSLLEVTKIINDGTLTAKQKRARLQTEFKVSHAASVELCPDSPANY